jgi:hypothetical protein
MRHFKQVSQERPAQASQVQPTKMQTVLGKVFPLVIDQLVGQKDLGA